jgi:hypothetical protein
MGISWAFYLPSLSEHYCERDTIYLNASHDHAIDKSHGRRASCVALSRWCYLIELEASDSTYQS